MAAVTALVLGAGLRGRSYSEFAVRFPDALKIVAVAEPDPIRREQLAYRHSIPENRCFASWEDALNAGKIADVVFNCTMDRLHLPSTLAALDRGYEVLLEKPMAVTPQAVIQLVQAAENQGRLLQICHVLRYTPFFKTLRDILASGTLGDIINIDHRENLVYWHMAHSFVRGNWRHEATSAPMILAKCCHDFDILYWMLDKPTVTNLYSSGSLMHFRPENAPHPDVPLRCTDGCPVAESCKFEAQRLYVTDKDGFPWDAVTVEATEAARLEALKTGPYGRCVYHCDNDVVDHQTVSMTLDTGTTITLIMNGHGFREERTMRYDGTQATLFGRFDRDPKLTIYHHRSGRTEHITIPPTTSGHGGGDFGIVESFLNVLDGKADDRVTSARESVESHLLAFAAEESRLTQRSVDLKDFRQRLAPT